MTRPFSIFDECMSQSINIQNYFVTENKAGTLDCHKKTRRVCSTRRVLLLTTTFQPVSYEIPAGCGFTLLGECLVDRHHHAWIDCLDSSVKQATGVVGSAVTLSDEIKLRNRAWHNLRCLRPDRNRHSDYRCMIHWHHQDVPHRYGTQG